MYLSIYVYILRIDREILSETQKKIRFYILLFRILGMVPIEYHTNDIGNDIGMYTYICNKSLRYCCMRG